MNKEDIQIEIEQRYSRRNIRKWVKDIIMEDESIVYAMSMATSMIHEYLQGDYYPSKNLRYRQFVHYNDIETVILETMIEVLQAKDGLVIFQQVTGKVSSYVQGMEHIPAIKTVSDIMGLMAQADLFDVIQPALAEEGVLMIQSHYSLDEPTLQKIANTKYLPPMIVQPQTVNSNKCMQYLTVKTSLIKKALNHHEEYLAYDVVNILQSYKLSLDLVVVNTEKELSKKPLDTLQKRENFQRMVNASKATYKEMIELGNSFYIPWSYDKRGRIYSDGYHINYQSTEFKKALINLDPLKVSKCKKF